MRIRIIGSCGSGKSTAARQLAAMYGINYYETDNLVWDRSEEGLRYPVEVRDRMLSDIVRQESWIIEGVHHKWGFESFEAAEYIYIIQPNPYIRDLRVVRRFIRTRFGLEASNYKQTLSNLREMIFVWNKQYDAVELSAILEMTKVFSHKVYRVKNIRELVSHQSECRKTFV
ncbi:hypothetical protein [Paenibacillus lutrae]|uniref:DNA topology modulation protein FlaR n=1 Tax=Paenibacillus lutrae TaxID=2078573 RepID=A0A7X3JZ16_9BACL|nr:hypothetical protein [Paenibacillus lutrae]MVO99544.1 hypothetical protein [Paenibacillus lutrae]